MIRRFRIINNSGQSWDMNTLNIFLLNPRGLGVGVTNEYVGSNGNYITLNQQTTLNLIEFDLFILSDINSIDEIYNTYSQFSQFLLDVPLTLEYTTGVGTYTRQCNLQNITKTERQSFNEFRETLSLEALTPWRIIDFENLTGANTGAIQQGKIYATQSNAFAYAPFNYDGSDINLWDEIGFVWDLESASTQYQATNNSITLGKHPTGLIMRIRAGSQTLNNNNGLVQWSISQNNKVLGDDAFNLSSIPEFWSDSATLVVSSDPLNFMAQIQYDDGRVMSALPYQDITRSNFVQAPIGLYNLIFNDFYEVELETIREWDVV